MFSADNKSNLDQSLSQLKKSFEQSSFAFLARKTQLEFDVKKFARVAFFAQDIKQAKYKIDRLMALELIDKMQEQAGAWLSGGPLMFRHYWNSDAFMAH